MDSLFFVLRCAAIGLVIGDLQHAAGLQATRIGCPSISVSSLDRSVSFYTTVLDFRVVRTIDESDTARLTPGLSRTAKARTAELFLGNECLDLSEYESPRGRAFPRDSHANDLWFEHIAIVVSNMGMAFAQVRASHTAFVSDAPQTLPDWNKEAAGISAFYFRDPDGHYLELIHFPPGKGQPKWQTGESKLFLGIDHTAIAVANTQRSLTFYRDILRLRVAGGSENYGVEQEHLSGVAHARVRITSLRAGSGIGVELLNYEIPDSCRPIPADRQVDDIAGWQIPIEVIDTATKTLQDLPFTNWKRLPPSDGPQREAMWIKDPDGHILKLVRPRPTEESIKQ